MVSETGVHRFLHEHLSHEFGSHCGQPNSRFQLQYLKHLKTFLKKYKVQASVIYNSKKLEISIQQYGNS